MHAGSILSARLTCCLNLSCTPKPITVWVICGWQNCVVMDCVLLTSLYRRICAPADLMLLPVASLVDCRPPAFALYQINVTDAVALADCT